MDVLVHSSFLSFFPTFTPTHYRMVSETVRMPGAFAQRTHLVVQAAAMRSQRQRRRAIMAAAVVAHRGGSSSSLSSPLPPLLLSPPEAFSHSAYLHVDQWDEQEQQQDQEVAEDHEEEEEEEEEEDQQDDDNDDIPRAHKESPDPSHDSDDTSTTTDTDTTSSDAENDHPGSCYAGMMESALQGNMREDWERQLHARRQEQHPEQEQEQQEQQQLRRSRRLAPIKRATTPLSAVPSTMTTTTTRTTLPSQQPCHAPTQHHQRYTTTTTTGTVKPRRIDLTSTAYQIVRSFEVLPYLRKNQETRRKLMAATKERRGKRPLVCPSICRLSFIPSIVYPLIVYPHHVPSCAAIVLDQDLAEMVSLLVVQGSCLITWNTFMYPLRLLFFRQSVGTQPPYGNGSLFGMMLTTTTTKPKNRSPIFD